MRSRFAFGAVLALGVASLLFVPGAAAQVATQDSVVLTGGPGVAFEFHSISLTATSGPSGENPTGQVRFEVIGATLEGPVTCLAVTGNTAIINFADQLHYGNPSTVQVVDGQPDAFDAVPEEVPAECSPPRTSGFGGALEVGDITVVDAQPFPTSTAQCKSGGWRTYGTTFKNQGDCVSFVEHQARQECIFIRAYDRPAFRARYGTPLTGQHAMRRCVRQRSDD